MLILSACAGAGDNPAEDQTPSTITPTSLTSDSPASVTSDPLAPRFDSAILGLFGPWINESEALDAEGDTRRRIETGRLPAMRRPPSRMALPTRHRDPDVPLSDLPVPTLDPPKYPDPEPVIPPPRDCSRRIAQRRRLPEPGASSPFGSVVPNRVRYLAGRTCTCMDLFPMVSWPSSSQEPEDISVQKPVPFSPPRCHTGRADPGRGRTRGRRLHPPFSG